MSIKVLDWALREAPVTDATETLVLVGLANHATDDGTAAFPAVATLAVYARCSPRTVHRKLRDLEDAGIIKRGDQQLLAHWRPDRRPIVYDVNMDAVTRSHPETTGCQDVTPDTHDTPSDQSGVTPEVARGDTGGIDGVTTVADEPSFNHPEPSVVVEAPQVAPPAPMENAPASKMRRGWEPGNRAMATAKSVMNPEDIPLHITKYEVWCAQKGRKCSDAEWLTWVVRDEEDRREKERHEQAKEQPKKSWHSVAD